MIGLDTNVLVRYIVQDDAKQAAAATRLIEGNCSKDAPGFISPLVLADLCWVLQRGYGYSRDVLRDVLTGILGTVELRVQEPAIALQALHAYKQGKADFADDLIGCANQAAGCETTWTFDRKAAKSARHRLVEA